MGSFKKADIEASLQEEHKMIQEGKLKEDNPLDLSDTFRKLCEACRRGDLRSCQEMITEGANINARDRYDYTPLILASLCGHYEVVQLLLESGALCERDTFQGERCLYNALNDRIRNLLLSYDYSKTADPLQPFAAHVTSLLSRDHPQTSDILVTAANDSFRLHKFILSARCPYFSNKLAVAPDTASWRLHTTIPPQAFDIAIRYLYFGETPHDVGGGPGTGFTEEEILEGIDKITKQLEIRNLWDGILESSDRRLARQRRTDEIERGRNQLKHWFEDNILKHKVTVDKSMVDQVRWDRDNGIFADVLLQADEVNDSTETGEDEAEKNQDTQTIQLETTTGIPIGPLGLSRSRSQSRPRSPSKSTLFPVHRAMLLRSEYFSVMFSSGFREAQDTKYLQIIHIDCSPEVLQVVLTFLYTEKTDFPLELAVDVLFAADLMLIEKLKTKAAVVISTLGSGSMAQIPARLDAGSLRIDTGDKDSQNTDGQRNQDDVLDIYDVIRAGWLTRVPRLEEFGARYIANRLELYIDEEAFADLVQESAARIEHRQETDTIELLDDIRYYLSERFRLRFEDTGIEELLEGEEFAGTEAELNGMITSDTDKANEATPPRSDQQPSSPASQELRQPTTQSNDPNSVSATTTTFSPSVKSAAGTNGDTNRDGTGFQGDINIDSDPLRGTLIRTLDGEEVGDEMEEEARNYQILLAKIDALLVRLRLDA